MILVLEDCNPSKNNWNMKNISSIYIVTTETILKRVKKNAY